jgi:hypothetical protein
MAISILTYFCVFRWNVSFSGFIPIMQIRHVLIKDHIKSSPLKLLNRIKPNLAGMLLGWSLFKIMSDSPALHLRWLLLLKIKKSFIYCCFIISQNESNFTAATWHWVFNISSFFQQFYTTKKFELKWALVGELSKLFVTLPFSLSFRSQIENQVSNCKLLRASSFMCFELICFFA